MRISQCYGKTRSDVFTVQQRLEAFHVKNHFRTCLIPPAGVRRVLDLANAGEAVTNPTAGNQRA